MILYHDYNSLPPLSKWDKTIFFGERENKWHLFQEVFLNCSLFLKKKIPPLLSIDVSFSHPRESDCILEVIYLG